MSTPVLTFLGVVVTTMGAIGVALIESSRRARRASENAAAAIGTPNGKGNVVQMLETLLAGQTGQDARLARLESFRVDDIADRATAHAWQTRMERRVAELEAARAALEASTSTQEPS